VLGLDPGVARTGYGVVERRGHELGCVTYGCVSTPAGQPLPARLATLYAAVRRLIAAYRPSAVAVEALFFKKNVRTGIAVGEARGVILLAVVNADVPLFELTPPQVKQGLTGYGRADKRQVQLMVQRVLKLPAPPRPDDAADALALAVTASQLRPS
jgi:crossover junction endodeoxyribonuclease RuvC